MKNVKQKISCLFNRKLDQHSVTIWSLSNTTGIYSQCLKTKDCQDDVHTSFAQLLSELNKPDAPYSLSVANRLYGEKSYQFVEVFVSSNEWSKLQ